MRALPAALTTVALLVSLAGCAASTTGNDPSPTTTPKPEYPKEVPISSLDNRFALWLGSEQGKTVAVQLAPGVYAERGLSPDLGTLEDYTSYVGLCADVNRYFKVHPGGHACW
jgi:hypothetical protein